MASVRGDSARVAKLRGRRRQQFLERVQPSPVEGLRTETSSASVASGAARFAGSAALATIAEKDVACVGVAFA
jgi:hypothetical protein